MTITKTIAMARRNLPNTGAYARIMAHAIRSAMSDRSANKIRKAIEADKMQDCFLYLDSTTPLAKES